MVPSPSTSTTSAAGGGGGETLQAVFGVGGNLGPGASEVGTAGSLGTNAPAVGVASVGTAEANADGSSLDTG